MARENESVNPFNNPDLEDTINQHMETSIHNKLMEYSQDKVYKDVREYKDTLNNEIKNIDEYIKNNSNNIIDKYNFQEGFNSRTGKEETYNTLLDEYRTNKVRDIKNELDENTSFSTLNEMQKSDNINMHKSETENDLKEYPIIKDNLNSFEQNLDDVVQESKSNLKDVKFEISEDRNTYNITTINTKNKESNHTFEFNNIADYKEMKNIENNKLEIEYDEYKDKAVNIVKNSSEDVHKIERELEHYDFASEKYNEYLKDKYTDFNQYLKDNNISNPYEKYSDDLIKNTKAYSDIRLKMQEIDDEHFYKHRKHVSNYIDYGEEIKSTSQNLQKLKSVELEKNVIGLLPKDQQENNYRETLSRLDKNKSTLKEDLKSYMSNTKIDNAINSVKHHFENIKVKAEDIHKNFKDLGSWNTENKFVKDIDNVINSVKELGKKHESELLRSDSDSIMTKLNSEYVELKNYINKADSDNKTYENQKDFRDNYVNNMLESKEIEVDFDPKELTKDLTDNQKLAVYNQLKDINHHYKNRADTNSMVKERDNYLIINQLESENPNLKDNRNDYINLKQSLSTMKLETPNEKLNTILNETNKDISKMDRMDKIGFKDNRKEETRISNQNLQSNKIKSNDMFKKMDKLHEESQKQQQTHSDDREPKKKPKMTR